MRFCLLRRVSVGETQKPETRLAVFDTRRLSIGSAPDQHVQLVAAGVEERHAVLTAGLLGGLRLMTVSREVVIVNGRQKVKARIRVGDVIEVGAARLLLHPSRTRRMVIFEVQEPASEDCTDDHQHSHAAVSLPPLRVRSLSWTLTLGCAGLFLIVPITGLVMPGVQKSLRDTPLLPSDGLWSPGPLHSAHQSIGTRCDACHTKPFQRVRDQACLVCHARVAHHVDVHSNDVALFQNYHCTDCHLEHQQPATLIETDQRLCTDCHADLKRRKPSTTVRDVTDFGTDHPEFRLTVLASRSVSATQLSWAPIRLDRADSANFVEHSHLRFSHFQHLNPKGVRSPTGIRVLTCQDCHRPTSSGRDMIPIRMEVNCSGCHSLRFDEHDPTSSVPHGDLDAVMKTLREHFARQYLLQSGRSAPADASRYRMPGNELQSLPQVDQQRALDWVDQQTLKIARELLEKRVCADCHEVTHVPGRTGLQQWHVVPVRLTSDWMPHARFDHAAHISETCESCHSGARDSKSATDILVPGIARCRQCHAGPGSTTKVASDCLMCHQFHIPSRGTWLRKQINTAQAVQ